MSRTQTRLLVIATPHPRAATTDLAHGGGRSLPARRSDQDLLCGGCGRVVMPGWSIAATSTMLVVEAHMLLRCAVCRSYNVVPTRKPEVPGDTWLRRGADRRKKPKSAPRPPRVETEAIERDPLAAMPRG